MRLPCHAIALLLKSFDFPGFTLSMAWLPCNPCGFASSPAALLEQIKETVDEAHEFHDQVVIAHLRLHLFLDGMPVLRLACARGHGWAFVSS